ncbi:hypothetical protein E3J62_09500 [candidate division TA06 bacterium]|uniref:SIR2-like domain-containing protein n=1 Tax=candidate division TA06 bacterium TaxID=2250710 RepID=A0A523UQG5_UNCT6|nr:MAG: hypothetical protein E3J62_09500 [candidate division TA06 bacterium]
MLTGLLMGAGASYELGMPLVWDLTAQLRQWLTPEKLWQLNVSWRSRGGGYPDRIIADFVPLLVRPDLHYESLLGHLETQYRRASHLRQHYHSLYQWLVDIVYHILYLRHIRGEPVILAAMRFFDGLAGLAEQSKPLWVFSLNHDVLIECIAVRHGIHVCSGFQDGIIELPRRDRAGTEVGRLRAEVMTGSRFEKTGLLFLRRGSPGINLLKIHGSLDVFAFKDGKDLLKLLPMDSSVEGVIASLRAANEELLYVDSARPNEPVKVTNEIAYADDSGEMQFLRRSLLAGMFKFDRSASQVLPIRLLDSFRTNVNHVTHLACVGYGFGDIHINQILRGWLEFTAQRRLEIVAPGAKDIPQCLLHLAPQVMLTSSTTTDYLAQFAATPLSEEERIAKDSWNLLREAQRKDKGYA